MSPVSFDRVKWIEERLTVLKAMVTELNARTAFYIQVTGMRDLFPVMQSIRAEEAQLLVELNVLKAMEVSE